MSAPEWVSAATAIGYIMRALNVQRDEAVEELVGVIAARRIAIGNWKGEAVSLSEKERDYFAHLPLLATGDALVGRISDFAFKHSDVVAAFAPLDTLTAENPAQDSPAKRGGGRPLNHDQWDRIVSEVVRCVHYDGVPRDIDPFADKILEWCQHKLGEDAPKKTILRKRITTWLKTAKQDQS